MTPDELQELQWIGHCDNLASVIALGILSHERAGDLVHVSVADARMQEIRAKKKVPGGLRLHEYANVYVNARNTMLYKVKRTHGLAKLLVLSISTDVLLLPGVVMTDMNAGASDSYVRFRPYPEGLTVLNREYVFADSWIHQGDEIATWRHRSAMCAEVLVPSGIEPDYIRGIYVPSAASRLAVEPLARGLPVEVRPGLFFL